MRSVMFARMMALLSVLVACHGKEAALKEAQEEEAKLAKEAKTTTAAVKLKPPVPGMAHIKCEQLIDVEKFRTALGETEPLTLRDTGKGEAEAAASCGLVRGGKRLNDT